MVGTAEKSSPSSSRMPTMSSYQDSMLPFDTNPNAFCDMVTTFWRPTDVDTGKQVMRTLRCLQEFLLEVEDRIEGV
jgi:hypothetical protein